MGGLFSSTNILTEEEVNAIQWTGVDFVGGNSITATGRIDITPEINQRIEETNGERIRDQSVDLIKKTPKKHVKSAKWQLEIEHAYLHSKNRTGPTVYFKNSHMLIMEKYTLDGIDLLENCENMLNRLAANLQMETMKTHTELLIKRLAKFYSQYSREYFCIGDFRLQNIVYKLSRNTVIDARQIDFDYCVDTTHGIFTGCMSSPLTEKEYVLLLKLNISYIPKIIKKLGERYVNFMFGKDLCMNRASLITAVRKIWTCIDGNSEIRSNMEEQTGLSWSGGLLVRVIKEIEERFPVQNRYETTEERFPVQIRY